MKKQFKREMKEDEFLTGLEKTLVWMAAHKTQLRNVTLAIAAVLVAAAALFHWQGSRDEAAREAYLRAEQVYHAPLRADISPGTPDPAGPVFDSAEERYEKAKTAFDGFERRYPRHALAPRARLYAGLSRIELGEREEAIQLLSEVASRSAREGIEPSQALFALGSLYGTEGEWDKAIETYQRLLDDSGSAIPPEEVLMALGSAFEGARRYLDARGAYERLSRGFPASVYAAAARQRAEYLEFAG